METITDVKLSNASDIGNSVARPKSRGRIRKFLWRGLLLLIVIGGIAQLAFTYSGSGQWEPMGEKNGTAGYSMKVPGSNLMKFKGVTRAHATLTKVVAFMQDDEGDLNIGFYPQKLIYKQNSRIKWNSFRIQFPRPFKDREFVVKHEFSQDPVTKIVTYTLTAAPDMLAPEQCCVTMPKINNSWRVTPIDKENVEIEWIMDMDLGGFMPYTMPNSFLGDLVYDFMPKLQGYFDDEKYNKAKIDWVQDL